MKLGFADCTLDVAARRLLRGDREVHLSPKAFELLLALVDRRGEAVGKAELLQRVWPDVFVSDASLARTIAEIRDGIGDDDRTIVRTVHAFGYAFDAPIASQSAAIAPARCFLASHDRTFLLPEGEHFVGRDLDLCVPLESPKVSRRHARIVVNGHAVTIEDLDSKNGTYVRGARITAPTRLHPGDEIRVGPFTLTFREARGPATTVTETASA